MSTSFSTINALLHQQDFTGKEIGDDIVYRYAEGLAVIENALVVVSDLKKNVSRIFHGAFSGSLGLDGTPHEDSIWEREIFSRLSPDELEAKYLAELRFYNFLRRIPRSKREYYYLVAPLRMTKKSGDIIDVLHRMFYRYEPDSDAVRFGICIYTPMTFSIGPGAVAIDSISGTCEELSSKNDEKILSSREKQVLSLIEKGFTSQGIAERLCISKNTVSRHRQEILSKLQVKNSPEACRRAKQLGLIV